MAVNIGTVGAANWYSAWARGASSPVVSGNMSVVGTDADRILIGFITRDATTTISSVVLDAAGTNQALVLINGVNNGAGQRVELWGLLNPAAVGSAGITVTFSGSGEVTVAGAVFRGADQGALAATCVFSSSTGTTNAATASVPTANGSATVSVSCDDKSRSGSNPGGVQTTIEISNVVIDSCAGYTLSSGAADTHTWAYSGACAWALGCLLIYATGQVPSTGQFARPASTVAAGLVRFDLTGHKIL